MKKMQSWLLAAFLIAVMCPAFALAQDQIADGAIDDGGISSAEAYQELMRAFESEAWDDAQDALPQPQLANFAKGKKYPVYSGPGTNYYRDADGKASVSTNDWIQVFGEEDGWLLVQYHVTDAMNRIGWINATQKEAGVSVPQLRWNGSEAICHNWWLTTDPLGSCSEIEPPDGSTSFNGRACTLLASLGASWRYVEIEYAPSVPMRAFVPSSMLTMASIYKDTVMVTEDEAALYADAQGQERIGTLYMGAALLPLETQESMLRVCMWDENAADGGESAARFMGWVDVSCVRDGTWQGEMAQERQMYTAIWSPQLSLYVREEPDEESVVAFSIPEYYGLYKLAETDDWAYVCAATHDAFTEYGYLPARVLMPIEEGYLLTPMQVQDCPSSYVSEEDVILRAGPREDSEPVARLIRGLNLFVLDRLEGWTYVDSGYGEYDGTRLRGYVPETAISQEIIQEKTHPIMRLNELEGDDSLYVGVTQMFAGAQCVLRAVTPDGEYGLCMFDMRLPVVNVPMKWLTDTGKRGEWNFEWIGAVGMIISQEGSQVPAWRDRDGMETWPDEPYRMLTPGDPVTVLAQQDGLALIILQDSVGETLVVRAQNVITAI